jgi:hypothetical protein
MKLRALFLSISALAVLAIGSGVIQSVMMRPSWKPGW